MLLTTILTAPRPTGVDYFSATLASLRQQNIEPTVFNDAAHVGNRKMMLDIFQHFITQKKFTRLLYLEDDITFAQGVGQFAQLVSIPQQWPLLSLFDDRIADARPQRLQMNCHHFLYNQALIFPRSTIEKLLKLELHSDPRAGINGSSKLLRRMMITAGFKEYGLQLPSLIKHIGEISLVTGGKTTLITSPAFTEETNALSLI